MENFALITFAEELKRAVPDVVIRRIVQHQPRGFILQTRTTRIPGLKFLLDPRSPAVYVSAKRPPAEHPAGEFVLVLRKHLVGARLVKVVKPFSERILEFTFRTALPARGLEQVSLLVELFPNAPNVLLFDAEKSAIAAWNRETAEALDFEPYSLPRGSKTDLRVAANRGDTSWFDAEAFESDPEGWLVRNVAGIGPVLASELNRRHRDTGQPLPAVLGELVASLGEPARTAWLYTRRPLSVLVRENDAETLRRSVISPIALTSARTLSEQSFPGMLETVRYAFDLIEEITVLGAAKSPYIRKLRKRKKRAAEHLRRLDDRRERFERATRDRESAELVVSSGLDLGSRKPEVQVVDYSDPQGRTKTIVLDPAFTVRENATRMFRAHRKAERGLRMIENQRRDAEQVLQAIGKEEEKVRSIGDWNAWHAFLDRSRTELRADSVRAGARGPVRPPRVRRGRSLSLDGREILVGRNSRENDELTFQVAAGEDFWLHAADYSGSHVIVRNPAREDELDENTLVRAAELAAYYSQARNSPKVEVHYTQRKFVKKPRRAKPGLVLLRQFRSLTVEPRNWAESERSG